MFNIFIYFMFVNTFIHLLISGDYSASFVLTNNADLAVRFCIEICGSICFWCAVSEVFEQCGAAAFLSRILRPFISRLMPESSKNPDICAAVSENISANILGLGNAATPAGIRAAKGIAALGSEKHISDDLCMLVVLNTASVQLIPTTAAAIRASAGAASPYDILPAVWFSTLCALSAGLFSAFILKRLWH